MDIVRDVMDSLGVPNALVCGYDWGGGIALSLAAVHPRRVSRLCVFHPNISIKEAVRLNLPSLKQPILYMQVKVEQFHPISAARALLRKLPPTTIFDVLGCGRYTADKPAGCFRCIADKVIASVGKWLQDQPRTALGTSPRGVGNPRKGLESEAPLSPQEAVAQLARAIESGELRSLQLAVLGKGNHEKLRGTALRLFSSLPRICPATLLHPQQLVDVGLWSAVPAGWESMAASARYFPGRQVLVESLVDVRDPASASYMAARCEEVAASSGKHM